MNDFNSQIAKYHQKESELRNHISHTTVKESRFFETENHLDKLMRENKGLEDVVKTNMLHISQLMFNIQSIKKDHELTEKEYEHSLECIISENRKLFKMIHLLKRNWDGCKNQLLLANRENERNKETINGLKDKLNEIKEDRDDLFGKLRALERDNNSLSNDLNNLGRKNGSLEEQLNQMNRELNDLRNQLRQKDLKNNKLERDNAGLSSQLSDLGDTLENKVMQIHEYDATTRNLTEENRNLENFLRDREAEIERLKKDFENKEYRMNQDFDNQLQGLEDELNRL